MVKFSHDRLLLILVCVCELGGINRGVGHAVVIRHKNLQQPFTNLSFDSLKEISFRASGDAGKNMNIFK